MNQEKPIRIFQALAVLLLCFPFATHAASGDDFIRGYASAVLEREFRLKDFSVNIAGESVTLISGELTQADYDRVIAALSSIDGVKHVAILDFRGVEVASSIPQASGIQRATRQAVPEYELGFLPGGNLFQPLIADPRWPRFSIGYRYFTDESRNVLSATFGETIALYRDRGPYDGAWEVGFQAGVFSIFDLDSESFDLVNSDFLAGLHTIYRIGDLSAFFRVFHQSSHLGDEFLLRNRIDRVNLSFEGLDLKLSYRFFDWARLYGGGTYLVHRDPSDLKPWSTQGGIELQTPWRFWGDSTRFVTALDVQNREENNWSTEVSVRGGLQFERAQRFGRRISLLVEYYNGHSPNGQFFNRKVEYFGPGLHLDF
ncbi:MAG TPA: DUF1207 domain-containing protein [Candidatus Binatia bacterium]